MADDYGGNTAEVLGFYLFPVNCGCWNAFHPSFNFFLSLDNKYGFFLKKKKRMLACCNHITYSNSNII